MKSSNVHVVLLVLLLAFGSSSADVGLVHSGGGQLSQIVVQFTPSGPDPFTSRWTLYLQLDPGLVLNPNGDLNGDGEPSFGFGPASIAPPPPTYAWAKQIAPGNHDPVYAQFINGTWTAPVVVSSNPGDDLDPQWWQDANGTIHVAWWRAGPNGSGGAALYASRAAGAGEFTPEESVSQPGELAHSAAMAVLASGEVFVAYETDPSGGMKRIVLASKATSVSSFQPDIIAVTSYLDKTDPQLKAGGGHTWASWIDSASRVGYSEQINGIWSIPSFETYNGPDDVSRARIRIQDRIMGH